MVSRRLSIGRCWNWQSSLASRLTGDLCEYLVLFRRIKTLVDRGIDLSNSRRVHLNTEKFGIQLLYGCSTNSRSSSGWKNCCSSPWAFMISPTAARAAFFVGKPSIGLGIVRHHSLNDPAEIRYPL